jgi:hypothetical protein
MSTTRYRKLAVLTAALVTMVAASPLARAADTPISLDEAYRQIKDNEKLMPVPTPLATTSMGTFDAATGTFEGLATEIEIINNKPVRLVPQVFVNAVNSRLTFGIFNSTQSVRVSVTGAGTAIVPAGRTSISIDIGRLRSATWTISSGTKVYRDQLTIKRPTIIGTGAFTIPALPVAVIYDPPQDPTGSNSVVYTRTTSVGTSVGFSVRKSTSSTATAVNPTFSELGMFQQQLQASAGFATATGNGTVATALNAISGALGKAKRNITSANDSLSTSRRTYTFTESHSCAIDAGVVHLGPGHSDMVAYLRNVRVVWFDNGFSTSLLVLGYGSLDCTTIDQLRSGVADLDPTTADALIALDPFAGALGPKAPLATDPRYLGLPGIGLLPDIVSTATYAQQLLVESSHVETSSRITTDDLGAGLLSIIGLAPSESQQVSSTLSVSNSADSIESTTVSTALTARTLVPGERTELAVFYDRTFGNIAFQDPRP